jgi:CheY-like chemotaxis protein
MSAKAHHRTNGPESSVLLRASSRRYPTPGRERSYSYQLSLPTRRYPGARRRPTTLGTYRTGVDTDMAAQLKVVIVVDDDAGFLKGVARLLAHNGIESRTFASAEALLDCGIAQTATCLLLDIHLGGISGIELQRRLAASGSKCPVIFMTANDDETTRNEAADAGCIAYLRKPFARHVLLDAIGKAVA